MSDGALWGVLIRIRCWWFGCEPHPKDPAPPEYAHCQHCGEIVSYEHMAGLTRYSAAKDWMRYWLFRRWCPTKCSNCGNRFGEHSQCPPF